MTINTRRLRRIGQAVALELGQEAGQIIRDAADCIDAQVTEAARVDHSRGTTQMIPTDAELIAWAGEEQFFLFCDEEEFLQIARAVLARYGRPAEISTTTVENTVDNCAAKGQS